MRCRFLLIFMGNSWHMVKHFLLVAAGGATGSMLRFLTSLITSKFFAGSFPLATFITNVLGCFLIGLFASIFAIDDAANQQWRLLLITGFCGGYTTFSTFSADNLALLNGNHAALAILNIAASVIVGIGAVWLGLAAGKA